MTATRRSHTAPPVILHNAEQILVFRFFHPLETACFRLFLRHFALFFSSCFGGAKLLCNITKNFAPKNAPSLRTKKTTPPT